MNGTDIASLKKMLTLGKYGAARPVSIDSKDTQDFILQRFGKYLGSAATSKSSYLNVWKEFGSSAGFTSIEGTTLPYTNWPAGSEYKGQNPQAVVMGSDGAWVSGQDGVRSSQIVEFPEKLDCALSPVDPSTLITPPVIPPPPPDPNTLSGRVCGQDLNSNGYVGEQGEVANCVQTPQGEYCPVGSTKCVETFSSPVCPDGSTLNTVRDMCQANPATTKCPAGYSWDTSIDKCVKAPPCPDGGIYNSNTDRCEKLVQNDCPTGYSYDAARDVCQMAVNCGAGGVLNPARDRCERPPNWDCPNGFSYNSGVAKCEADPYCPQGTSYNISRDRCEAAVGPCPSGYAYNSVLDKCVASVVCPSGGSLNGNTDKCELVSSVSCPSGWSYNSATGKCEQAPSCTSPGSYSKPYDLCLATVTGANCPTGYTWNAGYNTCIATPSCVGGAYNAANNRCEAPINYSCSDPAYSYNASRGRCEKTPVCSSGTYNGIYDKCLLTANISCPTGYTYNAGRNRCEKTPECPVGTSYSVVTNRCEGLPSCASGTYNNATNTCVSNGMYPATINFSCPSGGTLEGETCKISSTFPATTVSQYSQPQVGRTEIMKFKPKNDYGNWYSATRSWQDAVQFDFVLSGGRVVLAGECAFGSSGNCGCDKPHWNGWCRDGTDITTSYSGNTLYAQANMYWLVSSAYCVAGDVEYIDPESGVLLQCLHINPPSWQTCYDSEGWSSWPCYQSTVESVAPSISYTKSYTEGAGAYADLSEFVSCPPGTSATAPISQAVCNTFQSSWESWSTVIIPDCTNTGAYTCYKPVPACPVGSSFNGTSCTTVSTYSATPSFSCPSGGTSSGNQCITTSNAGANCPSGTWLDGGVDKCVNANPTCTGGDFDGGADVCWTSIIQSCPGGTLFDSAIGQCVTSPICSNGLLDTGNDKCFQSASTGCPGGYSQSGGICVASAYCASPGSLNGSIDYCSAVATFNCPAGYVFSAPLNTCYQTANCGSGSLNTSLDTCQQSFSLVCPGGYNLNGSTCQQTPACSTGGSYSASLNLCDGGSNVCALPTILDTTSDVCYQAASCGAGGLNTVSNKCEASATVNCGGWTWDVSAGICHSSPVCSSGIYNAVANECQAAITRNCGYYTWDSSAFKCTQSVVCPKDAAYSLNSTIQFDPRLDICVSDTEHNCSTGLTWNGLPVVKCEAVPVCTGDGIYNPEKNSCFEGLNTCPLGTQYTCMNYDGENRCSPNACVDADGAATIESMDESMLKDDARDPDGNCLGQLYIFNGKPSRCRPPGLTVGLINDCCKSDEVMSEDTGSAISTAISAIQTAYEIGQVAYYSSMVTSGAATLTPLVGTTSVGIVMASGSTTVLSGAVASGVSTAAVSGATGTAAVSSGLQAYASALLNPATIAIAVAIMVVIKVLMGGGCDQGDIQTGMQKKANDCHYVGNYCYKKYFFGCVQQAKGYCCFNSKMARIIHEEGRPQLTTFQPNGDWGSGKSPNCRGFTPEEFQALDFSRIDLSEYFDDIQKDLTNKIQNSQQTITDNINKKFQAVTK